MNYSEYQEREIDLIDLMWRLLEQWRLIIVVALIGAILLPLLIGFKSSLDSSNKMAIESETSESEIDPEIQAQLDSEYNSLSTALSSYIGYKSLEYLYQNSVLSQVDFKDGISVSSEYEIRLGDSNQRILPLYSTYMDIINNEAFTDALLEKYYADAIPGSLYDVCNVSGSMPTSTDDSDVAIITIQTTLPSNVSVEDWNDVLDSAISAYKKEVDKNLGKHNLTLISTNSREANDADLVRNQNQRTTEINTAQNTYKTAYNALTDDNKTIIDDLISKYEAKKYYNLYSAMADLDKVWSKHTKEVIATSTEASAGGTVSLLSAFSKKNIALGFMLAVVLYVCIYFAYVVLTKKVQNADELETMIGVNNFGGIYEYPYEGLLSQFAHDKKIYAKRHKSVGADKIAEDLSARLKFNDKTDVQLIVCGNGNDKTNTILTAQKSSLEKQGNNVNIVQLDKSISEMYDSEFSKMSTVFLQVISGETTYDMLRELSAKLREYNVDIVGSEFIQVGK